MERSETRAELGKIAIPDEVPPGTLRDYLEWLQELHRLAGQPSARELAKPLKCGHATITRMFKDYPASVGRLYELVLYLDAANLRRREAPAREETDQLIEKLDDLLSEARKPQEEGTVADNANEPELYNFPLWPPRESPKVDESLSAYVSDVAKIREAAAAAEAAKIPDKKQELTRLYGDALKRVHSGLDNYLAKKLEGTGFRLVGSVPRAPEGWPPEGYGGSANLPGWGIELLRSPWLGASVGVVHRSHPSEDLADLGLTFILATMTLDSQHEHIREFVPFVPGSPQLDQIISAVRGKIDVALPSAVAHFLGVCKESGFE